MLRDFGKGFFSKQVLWATAALFLVALFSILRDPRLLSSPRLWAEEGSLFYAYAYHNSFFESLTYIPTNGAGYYTLIANLVPALAARFFDPTHGPAVTEFFSLLIQLIPCLALLLGGSYLFRTPQTRFLGCFVMLFTPVAHYELWMNSINAMSYLGVAAFVILFADHSDPQKQSRWTLAFQRGILLVGTLSGPYTVFLAPAFWFKAWKVRNRESIIQGLISFFGWSFQVVIFFLIYQSHTLHKTKLNLDHPAMNFGNSVFAHFYLPTLGQTARKLYTELGIWKALWPDQEPSVYIRGGLFSLALLLPLLWLAMPKRSWRTLPRWFPISVCLGVSWLTAASAMYGVAQGRYAFVPGVCFALLVLSNLEFQEGDGYRFGLKRSPRSLISLALVLIGLGWGIKEFRGFRDENYYKKEFHPWSGEIEAWRKDPSYSVRLFPERFVANLQRKNINYDFKQMVSAIEPFSLNTPDETRHFASDGLPVDGHLFFVVRSALPPEEVQILVAFDSPVSGSVLAEPHKKLGENRYLFVERYSKPSISTLATGFSVRSNKAVEIESMEFRDSLEIF